MTEGKTEFCWLLETKVGDRPAWFKGKSLHGSGPEYTFDANEAVKFSSKEEAEASRGMKSPFHKYVALEHGFG